MQVDFGFETVTKFRERDFILWEPDFFAGGTLSSTSLLSLCGREAFDFLIGKSCIFPVSPLVSCFLQDPDAPFLRIPG